MDCTHKVLWRSLRRPIIVGVLTLLVPAWLAAEAQADGDPASDVLATQTLFLPQDAGLSAAEQAQLADLLSEAGRAGYRIRAAVIAAPADLGSVSELWRQPESYAHFLGQELTLLYHGTLLVVMPNGYGVYGVGGAAVPTSALHGLPPPEEAFGNATITAIRRLAASSGYELPLPRGTASQQAGGSDPVPWIVFGLGLALIAGAWITSLCIRPLRSRSEPPTGL